jgi:hypothetical protein
MQIDQCCGSRHFYNQNIASIRANPIASYTSLLVALKNLATWPARRKQHIAYFRLELRGRAVVQSSKNLIVLTRDLDDHFRRDLVSADIVLQYVGCETNRGRIRGATAGATGS